MYNIVKEFMMSVLGIVLVVLITPLLIMFSLLAVMININDLYE